MTDPYDTTYDPAMGAGALLIASLIWVVIGGGMYVWYAWALSKVFGKLGAPTWKAWVPVVNEAEVFARGGLPAWQVVFYYVPVVNIYALYLRWVATGRINAFFGKGSGLTVLAIVAAPIWATVLAGAKTPHSVGLADRISPATQVRSGAATPAGHPGAGGPAPTGQAAAPADAVAAAPVPPVSHVPGAPMGAPYAVKPVAQGAPVPPMPSTPPVVSPATPANPVDAAPGAPVSLRPPMAPVSSVPAAPATPVPPVPPAVPISPVLPSSAPVAEPPAPAVAAPTPAPETPPAAAAPVMPIVVHNPWAPRAESEDAALPAPSAPISAPPITPPVTPPITPPVTPPAAAAPESDSARISSVPVEIPTAIFDDEEDEDGETVVVDRRPRVSWFLAVDGAGRLPLKASHVLLGRRPTSAEKDTQALPIPDSTRTLSKLHARLDLVDGAWTITDLDSTNGVLLVSADGTETLVEPGVAAPLGNRFLLGKVAMEIEFEGPTA